MHEATSNKMGPGSIFARCITRRVQCAWGYESHDFKDVVLALPLVFFPTEFLHCIYSRWQLFLSGYQAKTHQSELSGASLRRSTHHQDQFLFFFFWNQTEPDSWKSKTRSDLKQNNSNQMVKRCLSVSLFFTHKNADTFSTDLHSVC